MSDRMATVACVEASGFFQFSRKSDFSFLFFQLSGRTSWICMHMVSNLRCEWNYSVLREQKNA